MKKLLFFILLALPLFITSQTSLWLSGSSHRSQLQDAWISSDASGELFYNDATLVRRTSTISLTVEQIIGEGLGGYGFTLKVNYQIVDDRRIGTDQYGNSFDFTELRHKFIPCLNFIYYFVKTDLFGIQANIGGHLQLEKLYLGLIDTELELNNSISPFIGAEAFIRLTDGRAQIRLRPFIQYQMQSIYFSEINEITGSSFSEAINGPLTGWVSGLSLSLYMSY